MLFLMSGFKILKVISTTEQAFYWADILVPKEDYYVNDVSVKGFSVYLDHELLAILKLNDKKSKADHTWSRDALLGTIISLVKEMDEDTTEVYLLRAKLKREYSTPTTAPTLTARSSNDLGDPTQSATNKRTPVQRSTTTAPVSKRPKANTASGRIWAKCDAILDLSGFEAVKECVMQWGTSEGINTSTVRTQYGHWRKFNNLG